MRSTGAFRLALLAVFRVVRKLFVVEEKLLTRCEYKLGPAIHALQFSVNKTPYALPAIGEGLKFPASHAIAAVGCRRSRAIFVCHEHTLIFVY